MLRVSKGKILFDGREKMLCFSILFLVHSVTVEKGIGTVVENPQKEVAD